MKKMLRVVTSKMVLMAMIFVSVVSVSSCTKHSDPSVTPPAKKQTPMQMITSHAWHLSGNIYNDENPSGANLSAPLTSDQLALTYKFSTDGTFVKTDKDGTILNATDNTWSLSSDNKSFTFFGQTNAITTLNATTFGVTYTPPASAGNNAIVYDGNQYFSLTTTFAAVSQ
jgi:hypothetical protein